MTTEFRSRRALMVSKEMCAARREGDADRMAEVLASLLNSVGFSIALSCDGDTVRMSTMLVGADGYMNEMAATHAPIGKMFTKVPIL